MAQIPRLIVLLRIDRMQCLNMTLFALFSERRHDKVIKAAKKQSGNASGFLRSVFCHVNFFQCFEFGQASRY